MGAVGELICPLEMLQPPAVGMTLGRLLGIFLASFTLKDVHPGVSKSLARVCCVCLIALQILSFLKYLPLPEMDQS